MIRAVCERLVADLGFRPDGPYLRKGRCPECGRPELWTEAARPWVLFCGRLNKCGARISTRQLYPELFAQFAKHHPATSTDPHATAKAYVRSRGLDPEPLLRAGVIVQGSRGVETEPGRWVEFPTVKFPLAAGVACHRLIDHAGRDKNRFEGSYKGRVWAPPGFQPVGEVWLTEGILDALSLIEAGQQAVSVISAGHVPAAWLASLRHAKLRLVIALDNDRAGRDGAAKLAAACTEHGIDHALAFPPEGRDWNDLLLHGDLKSERIEETLAEARWRGQLAAADSAENFFAIWSERRSAPLFTYRGCYWRGRRVKDVAEVRRLSDFTLEPLFALQRKGAQGLLQHTLRLKVTTRQRSLELPLDGRQMANQRDFKIAVWTGAMANWVGRQEDLDLLIDHLQAKKPTVVREVDVVGYDAESDCYLFPDCAYGPDGKRAEPDANGFVPVGGRLFYVNASDDEKAIALEPGGVVADALRLLEAAYGEVALAALGFFAASLFAEQFSARPASRFFPFLSLYGPPGTGKSALVVLLNTLLGRAVDEGLSIEEVDTAKGTTRLMASVSNLPIAVLEMDKAKARRFNMNRLLTLFNRAPLQTRANRSQDLTVNTLRFRGALVFAQNVEQFAGEAQKGRVVSLPFRKERQNRETLAALLRLQNTPPGQLARFRHEVLTRRAASQESVFEGYRHYASFFHAEGIDYTRVANNHAIVLAGAHVALHAFLPATEAEDGTTRVAAYLLERARAKVATLADESDYASLFFETVARLMVRDKLTNHCRSGQEVWLNMGEVKEVFDAEHISFYFPQLFEEFENSPHVKFRNVLKHSPVAGRTIRLYGFDRAVIHPNDGA